MNFISAVHNCAKDNNGPIRRRIRRGLFRTINFETNQQEPRDLLGEAPPDLALVLRLAPGGDVPAPVAPLLVHVRVVPEQLVQPAAEREEHEDEEEEELEDVEDHPPEADLQRPHVLIHGADVHQPEEAERVQWKTPN